MHSPAIQFESNLKNPKHVTISWDHEKKVKDEKSLIDVEAKLEALYNNEGVGCLTEESKTNVNILKERRQELLANREGD